MTDGFWNSINYIRSFKLNKIICQMVITKPQKTTIQFDTFKTEVHKKLKEREKEKLSKILTNLFRILRVTYVVLGFL